MWHEARKQEKKIRVMVVDYKKRAERRREFYEKFKADPTQFMQVHGRPGKIHLDPQVTAAADNCMMPWQGDKDNMIDRFDVRAHLDVIPEYHSPPEGPPLLEENPSALGYERYRILIQNELSKVTEDKFLHQIHLEEQYGTAVGPGRHKSEASKSVAPKAAIGYNYDDSNPIGNTWSSGSKSNPPAEPAIPEEESDEEVDFDLLVNMDDLTLAQKAELNSNGEEYGLGIGEFMNYLNADLEEKEQMRLTKLQEEEKQAMSVWGRKARRERRAYKDRMILRKGHISPPSYAALDSLVGEVEEKRSSSESRSRSSSPEKIEFITSFGGNESDREKDQFKDKLPINSLGSAFLSGLAPRQARKWAKSRSRSPERRKMRSRSNSRDRSSRYRSTRDRKDRHRRSSSSSSSTKRSRRRRHKRRSSSRSSSSSRSRSRERSRRRSHRTYSKSRNGRSRSRSRGNKRSRRDRSSERKRKSSSSGTSSSSSSRSRSPNRNKRVKSTSRRQSSPSRSPRSKKSKSKERTTSVISKPSVSHSMGVKNGSEPYSNSQVPPKLPSPPLKRYYGRRKEESESDSISLSDSAEDKPVASPEVKDGKRSERNSGPKGKSSVSSSSKTSSHHTPTTPSGSKLKPQERLKKKMQAALNRQLRADKEAEKVRQDKQDQERMEREETLRELTIKYRRRERERRHREIDFNPRPRSSSYSSDASLGSHSSGRQSKSRSPSESPKRRRPRSRSNSP